VAFATRVLEETRRLPDSANAALVSWMPLWGFEQIPIAPEGIPLTPDRPGVRVVVASVSEDYFATMGIAITDGRPFADTDAPDAPRVAVINETLARRHWPDRSPIGRRFRPGSSSEFVEIVGVASDAKYLFVLERQQGAVYFPFRQVPRSSMVVLAATSGPSLPKVAPLRDAVRRIDPELPVFDAQTIETFYEARATGMVRVVAQLIGGLGVIGVLLTMAGLYGLVSYAVASRTREIGIRMAAGATYGQGNHQIQSYLGRTRWSCRR
jgi:hypothetical protein